MFARINLWHNFLLLNCLPIFCLQYGMVCVTIYSNKKSKMKEE